MCFDQQIQIKADSQSVASVETNLNIMVMPSSKDHKTFEKTI